MRHQENHIEFLHLIADIRSDKTESNYHMSYHIKR